MSWPQMTPERRMQANQHYHGEILRLCGVMRPLAEIIEGERPGDVIAACREIIKLAKEAARFADAAAENSRILERECRIDLAAEEIGEYVQLSLFGEGS